MEPKEIMGKLLDEYAADQRTRYVVRDQDGKIVYKSDYMDFAQSWVDLQLDPELYNIEVNHE